MWPLMWIEFHAPMKAPTHPVPSGDRRMARLLMRVLARGGHKVTLASSHRCWEGKGDAERQAAIRARGALECADLTAWYERHGPPDLWFTYHLYHKAPDLIGPALCERFSADDMRMLAPAVKTRCKTLADGRDVVGFALIDDGAVEFDGKALHKALLKGEAKGLEMLRLYRDALPGVEPFTPEVIEQSVKDFCEQHEVGMGKVAQPIRVAVTGGPVSPPLGQTLAIIGRDAVVRRIDRCISEASE